MGFSTVAAQIIFFIVVIVAAVSLAGIFTNYLNTFNSSVNTQTRISEAKIKTAISITEVKGTTTDINVSVRNTGETMLNKDYVDIFIDGVFIPKTGRTETVEPSTDSKNVGFWDPLERLAIDINSEGLTGLGLVADTTYEVLVETENGIRAVRKFSPS